MKKSGIYVIECRRTRRLYVGSSVDISARWREHERMLRQQRHHSPRLQKAWDKHGADCFSFDVLELVEPKRLAEREQFWLDCTGAAGRSGFNVLPNARTPLGRVLSKETRAKISRARAGKPLSPEHRAKMLEILARTWSRTIPPEERTRRAASAAGKKHSAETRAKLREIATGRKLSEATKAKIGAAFKGRPPSPQAKAAAALAHTGAKRSAEARQRMSEAQKRRFRERPPARDESGRIIA